CGPAYLRPLLVERARISAVPEPVTDADALTVADGTTASQHDAAVPDRDLAAWRHPPADPHAHAHAAARPANAHAEALASPAPCHARRTGPPFVGPCRRKRVSTPRSVSNWSTPGCASRMRARSSAL